jgi:Spy/CpxP family protein refolding chaperone
MNSKTKFLLVLLSVTLNVAFVAGWGWRTMHASPGTIVPPPAAGSSAGLSLHQQLGLTPEQWRQIEPGLAQFRKETAASFEQMNRQRNELLELLAAPQPDQERLRLKQQEIQATQRQCQERLLAHILAERQVLSPEQQRKYFDLLRQQPGAHLPERILGQSHPPQTNNQPTP